MPAYFPSRTQEEHTTVAHLPGEQAARGVQPLLTLSANTSLTQKISTGAVKVVFKVATLNVFKLFEYAINLIKCQSGRYKPDNLQNNIDTYIR